MKKSAAILATLCAIPLTSQAELLFSVEAKVSSWDAAPSGQLDEGVSAEDENDGLGLNSNTGNQYELIIDHPVPLVPGLRLAQTSIDFTGEGNIAVNVGGFGNQQVRGRVDSFLDISHTDVTLVWGLPIPAPFIDINVGLTGRSFDGEIIVTERDGLRRTEQVDFDFTIPLLLGQVTLDTPIGVYGFADIQHINYDGNSLTDIRYAVGVDIPMPLPMVDLGVEVGYRSMELETDEDDVEVDTDFEVDGTYYGVSLSVGL